MKTGTTIGLSAIVLSAIVLTLGVLATGCAQLSHQRKPERAATEPPVKAKESTGKKLLRVLKGTDSPFLNDESYKIEQHLNRDYRGPTSPDLNSRAESSSLDEF